MPTWVPLMSPVAGTIFANIFESLQKQTDTQTTHSELLFFYFHTTYMTPHPGFRGHGLEQWLASMVLAAANHNRIQPRARVHQVHRLLAA